MKLFVKMHMKCEGVLSVFTIVLQSNVFKLHMVLYFDKNGISYKCFVRVPSNVVLLVNNTKTLKL